MHYAYQNGDPRKVYHGMDYEGNLCGVDLPFKPYVYWCKTSSESMPQVAATGLSSIPAGAAAWLNPTGLDFEHPICVEFCPQSAQTSSRCYDEATGGTKMTQDYATHAVAKRACLPQATEMMDKVNEKLDGHPIQKYIPQVIATCRAGWPVLLGAVGLALILSSIYLLLIEWLAGLVIWLCMIALILLPGVCGGYLVYASQHGGLDGIPSSGDAKTDLHVGIGCCVISAFFLLVTCCMRAAIDRAINVVECAAECLFQCKSLLLEPIINLAARMFVWLNMLGGLAWIVSVGEVEKQKIYRSFTYTEEQWVYIIFYVFMMLWINDFCTAMSQYVIANAATKWYFTEHSGGMKLAPSCLLCRGYFNGWVYHFGSLAFGSLLIALLRPIRIVVMALVYAEDLVDNAACGCVTKCCLCCVECFNSFLVHLSKNAYIDISITSKNFCAAGTNAAELLARQSKTLIASAGATWLFTLVGLASVTVSGGFITSLVVTNAKQFNDPSEKYYIQDPMVCSTMAAVICFVVALCFMIVFDSVTDTMILCLAYDKEEAKNNPVPVYRGNSQGEVGAKGCTSCGGWFGSQAPAQKALLEKEVRRPSFTPAKMQNW